MADHTTVEVPEIKNVAEGIVVRQAIDNMGWADMGGYTVVIDALEKPSEEQEVIRAIQETIPSQPISKLINTHLHPDHTALNNRFQELYGTEIVNLRTYPDIAPEDGLHIKGEQRSCQVLPMPGCHTSEDAVVWFPQEAVLFPGDIFGWGMVPSIGSCNNSVLKQLISIYDNLISLNPATVVPGHGPLASAKELEQCREYFAWLGPKITELAEQGLDRKTIMTEVKPPEEMQHWWRFAEWKHEHNVRRLVQSIAS